MSFNAMTMDTKVAIGPFTDPLVNESLDGLNYRTSYDQHRAKRQRHLVEAQASSRSIELDSQNLPVEYNPITKDSETTSTLYSSHSGSKCIEKDATGPSIRDNSVFRIRTQAQDATDQPKCHLLELPKPSKISLHKDRSETVSSSTRATSSFLESLQSPRTNLASSVTSCPHDEAIIVSPANQTNGQLPASVSPRAVPATTIHLQSSNQVTLGKRTVDVQDYDL